MSFEEFEADVVESFLNTTKFLFGDHKRNNSGEEEIDLSPSSTTEDPFFQDIFFHPDLIEDDDDCKVILHVTIGDSLLRVWDHAQLHRRPQAIERRQGDVAVVACPRRLIFWFDAGRSTRVQA